MNEMQPSKKLKKRRKKSSKSAVADTRTTNNNNVKKVTKSNKRKKKKIIPDKNYKNKPIDSDSEVDIMEFSDNDDGDDDPELLNDVENFIKTLGLSKFSSNIHDRDEDEIQDSDEDEVQDKKCHKPSDNIKSPKKKKLKIDKAEEEKTDKLVSKKSAEKLKSGSESKKVSKNCDGKDSKENNFKKQGKNVSEQESRSTVTQKELTKVKNDSQESTNKKMSSSSSSQEKKKEIMEKLKKQLQSASFRLLNEKLYTSSGDDAYQMFKEDPKSFQVYHEGYSKQVAEWPVNPIDVIIPWIRKKPRHWVIADFGCGNAILSKRVKQKVISIDLKASAPNVIECNMADTPLEEKSVNVVVFCLSLMGTNLTEFIVEANRVLVMRGVLKIAEIESRFENKIGKFLRVMNMLGFDCIHKNQNQNYFWLFDFIKIKSVKLKPNLPELILKPCMYKKR